MSCQISSLHRFYCSVPILLPPKERSLASSTSNSTITDIMLIHSIISLALSLSPAVASPISLAARAPDLIKKAELIVLPISCHPIYNLVTLVINRSGRPFCSDYIGIPTETIKYFATATETEYSTQTHTISETTTLVDRTLTETSAATTTEVISLTSTDTTTLTKYVTEFSTRTSLVYARTVTQWSDLE